jgi:bacterioferritin-associated ferredoxin
MYVCLCNGISDRQIREVVDRGAHSLKDVRCYLPVAECCGRCEELAEEIIETQRQSDRRCVAA